MHDTTSLLRQLVLYNAHSFFSPRDLRSCQTHSSHVFLLLPLPLQPSILMILQDVQSVLSLRSKCPNYLNLPRLTTSVTLFTPKRWYSSAPDNLSLSGTPHIHRTIISYIKLISATDLISNDCHDKVKSTEGSSITGR